MEGFRPKFGFAVKAGPTVTATHWAPFKGVRYMEYSFAMLSYEIITLKKPFHQYSKDRNNRTPPPNLPCLPDPTPY